MKDSEVGNKEFDVRDEYKGQDDGTAVGAAGEATQGIEFGHGHGEHASVTPLRQKRFFKDLSPPQMSPPDSGDGVISPLKGGSEGRHQSTLPSIFDSGRKESAARDLDVETGVSKERGRLPGIGDAHVGQGDGDRVAVSSVGAAVSDGEAEYLDEGMKGQKSRGPKLSRAQQRHARKAKARAAEQTRKNEERE